MKLPGRPDRKAGEESRVLRGRVKRCRVVTVRAFSEIDLQTHLTIEAE